jgi:hypothetical protein
VENRFPACFERPRRVYVAVQAGAPGNVRLALSRDPRLARDLCARRVGGARTLDDATQSAEAGTKRRREACGDRCENLRRAHGAV